MVCVSIDVLDVKGMMSGSGTGHINGKKGIVLSSVLEDQVGALSTSIPLKFKEGWKLRTTLELSMGDNAGQWGIGLWMSTSSLSSSFSADPLVNKSENSLRMFDKGSIGGVMIRKGQMRFEEDGSGVVEVEAKSSDKSCPLILGSSNRLHIEVWVKGGTLNFAYSKEGGEEKINCSSTTIKHEGKELYLAIGGWTLGTGVSAKVEDLSLETDEQYTLKTKKESLKSSGGFVLTRKSKATGRDVAKERGGGRRIKRVARKLFSVLKKNQVEVQREMESDSLKMQKEVEEALSSIERHSQTVDLTNGFVVEEGQRHNNNLDELLSQFLSWEEQVEKEIAAVTKGVKSAEKALSGELTMFKEVSELIDRLDASIKVFETAITGSESLLSLVGSESLSERVSAIKRNFGNLESETIRDVEQKTKDKSSRLITMIIGFISLILILVFAVLYINSVRIRNAIKNKRNL